MGIATLTTGEIVGTWIAAILTLCIFSFLYKDNHLYKFAEYLFVGSSAGYFLATTWQTNFTQYVFQPVADAFTMMAHGGMPIHSLGGRLVSVEPAGAAAILAKLLVIVPAAIGLMMVSMLTKNHGWLSRYPICFLVGYGSGTGIVFAIKTDIIPQLKGTMLPLLGVAPMVALQHLVIILCVLTGIFYFFFSMEHRGPLLGVGSRVGIFILMITFGAQFGTTIMGRIQLLVGRMDFLIYDWFFPLVLRH